MRNNQRVTTKGRFTKRNQISVIGVLTVCFVLLLSVSGCGASKDDPGAGTPAQSDSQGQSGQGEQAGQSEPAGEITINIPGLDRENFPRIDASTANMPLLANLYRGFFGVPQDEAEAMVSVSGGTGAVWRSLMWDGADLLLVYEAPEGIMGEIKEQGIELEIDPIGRDGLVFLVNKKNTVNDLSIEQLQGIYTGKITDWSGVGGEAGPISAFQRNQESGSQTLFLKLLMGGLEPMKPPVELVPGSMSGLIEAVATFDGAGGAIGYSVFYYADLMFANPDLKLLSVNGIEPSYESIFDETYPLINDFYVAIRADAPPESPARLLRDWFLTDEGTALLKAANYVPVR